MTKTKPGTLTIKDDAGSRAEDAAQEPYSRFVWQPWETFEIEFPEDEAKEEGNENA